MITPDCIYQSPTIAKLVNYVMRKGKKTIAEKVVYGALKVIADKTKKDPVQVFEQAIKNVSPVVEVKARRVGGSNYQVPVEVTGDRKLALTFRWIIGAASSKKGKPFGHRLAMELMSASANEGDAIKKKEDVHRMAEANRAFAHFA